MKQCTEQVLYILRRFIKLSGLNKRKYVTIYTVFVYVENWVYVK
jgi:hypothetical protein